MAPRMLELRPLIGICKDKIGNEPVIQPIQNGEAVIVLDCQNELQKLSLEKDDPHLMPRINVHDDLTFIVPKDEMEKYLLIIKEVMLKIRYQWQRVPLMVEASWGTNWCDMKPTEPEHKFWGDYVR